MGFLRLYLALCVISVHSSAVFFGAEHHGTQAVQIFFAISGFYMAMVLSESYKSTTQFYISRATRIYIPYFAILLSICLVSLAGGLVGNHWLALTRYVSHPLKQTGLAGLILAAVSNLTIFFQDWTMFLQHDAGGHLHFTANVWQGKTMLWQYLIIPQAWSVDLELTFYLLAPLLNRLSSKVLLLIILSATGLRLFCAYKLKLDFDPWTYRFFPFELATFLIGMLSYRIYKRVFATKIDGPQCSSVWLSYSVLLSCLFLYAWGIRKVAVFGQVSYFALAPLLFVIPLLFYYFRHSRFDRYVGELSYPVYLLHLVMVPFAIKILRALRLDERALGHVVALLSVLAALVLVQWLILPLDRWRKRFKEQPGPHQAGIVSSPAAAKSLTQPV